jgi:hypothetical protein
MSKENEGDTKSPAKLNILGQCLPTSMTLTRKLLSVLDDTIKEEEEKGRKRLNYIEVRGDLNEPDNPAMVLIDTIYNETDKEFKGKTFADLDADVALHLAEIYGVHIKKGAVCNKKIKFESEEFIVFED